MMQRLETVKGHPRTGSPPVDHSSVSMSAVDGLLSSERTDASSSVQSFTVRHPSPTNLEAAAERFTRPGYFAPLLPRCPGCGHVVGAHFENGCETNCDDDATQTCSCRQTHSRLLRGIAVVG